MKILSKCIVICFVGLGLSCLDKKEMVPSKTTPILSQLEISLDSLAKAWYPKTVDSVHGGFWTDFDSQWIKKGPQQKMLVSQARHIWSTTTLAEHYKDATYEKMAAHGFSFLKNKMWDSIHGGFFSLLGLENDVYTPISNSKSAYGNSFAIYSMATYYKLSKDTASLELAKKTFYWLEEHAHDPVHKGYFDVLGQDGSWLLNVKENDKNYDSFIRKDWKDQNSSIHLLECFTALYEVWPDQLLQQRLEELLTLVRDTITTEKGYLTLHLQRDWTPVSFKDSTDAYRKQNFWLDHVSFGHDVETAFLMLEASHMLGRKKDTITHFKAKKMVDHALEKGWDPQKGGFYDGGYYRDGSENCTIENPAKVWWTQAEGLNTLLLMSQLYPNEERYYELFLKQWDYISTYMIDHKNGGWYHEGLDSNPEAVHDAKSHMWKVNYHTIRSMVNVIHMLRGDFELTKNTKESG